MALATLELIFSYIIQLLLFSFIVVNEVQHLLKTFGEFLREKYRKEENARNILWYLFSL
jgi:hypothetical protein